MKKTSVHLKPCDIATSEIHNTRKKDLDYIRKELSHLNESFYYIPHSLQEELAVIKREVKAKNKRKLQRNAIPLKEGVIVIDEDTTMEDLKRFCERCHNELGIIPLQIHIHRDEGHVRSKEWKPNLHAHIVFRMYDENGKNVRMSKEDCAALQTIAAETLGMQRGKSSTKQHLSSLEFKAAKLEEEVERLSNDSTALKKRAEGLKEGVVDLFTGKSKRKAQDAEKKASEALKEAEAKVQSAIDEKNAAERALSSSMEAERKALNAAAYYKREFEATESLLSEKKDELKEYKRREKKETNIHTLLSDASFLGLTAEQVLTLLSGKNVSLPHIFAEGHKIEYKDGSPIPLKIEASRIVAKWVIGWKQLRQWVTDALKNAHFIVDGMTFVKGLRKGPKLG